MAVACAAPRARFGLSRRSRCSRIPISASADTPRRRKMRSALAPHRGARARTSRSTARCRPTPRSPSWSASGCCRTRACKGEANVLILPNLDAANIAYQFDQGAGGRAAGRADPDRPGEARAYPDALGDRARHRQHDGGRGGRGPVERRRGDRGRGRAGCRHDLGIAFGRSHGHAQRPSDRNRIRGPFPCRRRAGRRQAISTARRGR